MQLLCQLVILALHILGFFICVHRDFEGQEARQPTGYGGFIGTAFIYIVLTAAYFKSGAFSEIF